MTLFSGLTISRVSASLYIVETCLTLVTNIIRILYVVRGVCFQCTYAHTPLSLPHHAHRPDLVAITVHFMIYTASERNFWLCNFFMMDFPTLVLLSILTLRMNLQIIASTVSEHAHSWPISSFIFFFFNLLDSQR